MGKLLKDMLFWLVAHYDKLIAFMVLVGLLLSMSYLGVKAGAVRGMQEQFDTELDMMKPQRERASEEDILGYKNALKDMLRPFQLGHRNWTNAMFVPESRVWCVDCRRPIPLSIATSADRCPFCRVSQPRDPRTLDDYDGDKDGMYDKWERQYGLDPLDPNDGESDRDSDGFTSIEEFNANPRTDPSDPHSYPSVVAKLRLVRVHADPFKLRFKSTIKLPAKSMVELPDKSVVTLAVRDRISLPDGKTLDIPAGDDIALAGNCSIHFVDGLNLTVKKENGEEVGKYALFEPLSLPAGSMLHMGYQEGKITNLPPKSILKSVQPLKFAINTRGHRKTYFNRLGDMVEGFKLAKYEEKYEMLVRAGRTQPQKTDVSELTLVIGSKPIVLVKGQDVMYRDYIAYLFFALNEREYTVKIGDKLDLKDKKYEVIGIDTRTESVVIRRLNDNKKFKISRFPRKRN